MNPKYKSHIAYFILVNKDERISYFNHYYKEHINYADIISKIINLPKDIAEIYLSKEKLINMRMSGIIDGYYIRYIDNIEDILKYKIKTKFLVVSEMKQIQNIYQKIGDVPFILLSNNLKTDKTINLYNFKDIKIVEFQNIFEKTLKRQDQLMQNYCKNLKEATYDRNNTKEYIKTYFEIEKNIYTSSNINTLCSIRTLFNINDNKSAIKNSQISIKLLDKIKEKIFHNLKTYDIPDVNYTFDYIISDISKNLDFQINKKDYTLFRLKDEVNDANNLIEAIKFLKIYDFLENINSENEFLEEYIRERNYIEQLISILSASYVIPNIKLPINEVECTTLLKEIGNVDRSKSNKIHQSYLKLENFFDKKVSNFLDHMGKESSYRLKLVSNLPLEWISHYGMPLMIKNEVSRIPISPGYLTEKLLLDNEQIHLSHKAFRKILFISSFNEQDPIKDDIKNKVRIIQQALDKNLGQDYLEYILNSNEHTKGMKIQEDNSKFKIQVEWKNIKNKEELISVLDTNNSALAIFDMHGDHSEDGDGVLVLEEEIVYISSLINKIKMPPIIILSSCDTNPIDRNHYSVSNMFLLAGAKTVLASALSIQSHESSVYISRLLIRLSVFLHTHLITHKQSIRWSTFITGMIRQSYYTELLFKLRDKKLIKNEQIEELNFFINININPLALDFHNIIYKEVRSKANLTLNELNKFIEDNHKMAECLKYIQMGNPENLIIIPDDSKLIYK